MVLRMVRDLVQIFSWKVTGVRDRRQYWHKWRLHPANINPIDTTEEWVCHDLMDIVPTQPHLWRAD